MVPTIGLRRRYYLYRMTTASGFIVPVAIYILLDREFSMGFILFAYAVFSFATIAAEIPTGYLGDWLGRRPSLALGSVIRIAVFMVYPFLQTQPGVLAVHVLWATGRSFLSGTQDAWLYELLATYLDESEFTRTEGRGSTTLLLTSAGAAIAGGFLYEIDIAYPFFANIGISLLGLPLLYTFPASRPNAGSHTLDSETPELDSDSDQPEDETDTQDHEIEGLAGDRLTIREAIRILRLQISRPSVRWFVAYAALINSLFLITRIYEQPALESIGIPVTGFGVLYAAFKLVSAGAASSAGWVRDHLGTRRVFMLLVPVYGVAYLGVALVPVLVVPTLFLNRGIRVLRQPIRNQYLNDRLEDAGRATVLSGAAMVLAFGGGMARLASGWLADSVGPVTFLGWSGVGIALAGAILWLLVDPVRSAPTEQATPQAVPSD